MPRRKAPLLPGYAYNRSTMRYRDRSTGRFVARRQVVSLLETHVRATEDRLVALTRSMVDGKLSPSVWVVQMRGELKALHLQNAALGAGGWDRLTPKDYGRIGGKLRDEYRRMATLASEVAEGKVSEAQALNRLHMYLGNARSQYYRALRDRLETEPGFVAIVRRLLGVADHCEDCPDYARLGWQLPESLPVIGESACDGNCRCSEEWQAVPEGEIAQWIGTKR